MEIYRFRLEKQTLPPFWSFFNICFLRKQILTQETTSTNSLHSVMPRYLSLLCKVHICHSQSLCILKVVFFFSYFCVCVSKQTAVNKLNVRTKTINLCFQVRNNGKKVPGADPRFFLGGAAPLSKQIVNFFWQNTICIRKQQVMSGERGCAPLHPPLRSAPKFLVQG